MVKLVYFAWVRERMGMAEEMVELPASVVTIADLALWLAGRSKQGMAVPATIIVLALVTHAVLAMSGIGIDEARAALNSNNVNLPSGTIDGANKAVTLIATGQLKKAEEFSKIIVSYRNGAPVRLGDVATVVDGVENEKSASWFLNRSTTRLEYGSIVLFVQRQPGTNTIKVVDGIKELLPSFRSQLPAAISLDIYSDRSIAIRESVHDVKFTLVLAVCLVVLVIFLFLRTLWATIIPSITMPIAILGTFGVMYFFKFSIDNLSLLALTLSV